MSKRKFAEADELLSANDDNFSNIIRLYALGSSKSRSEEVKKLEGRILENQKKLDVSLRQTFEYIQKINASNSENEYSDNRSGEVLNVLEKFHDLQMAA